MKNWDRDKTLTNLYKALFLFTIIVGFVLLFYWALPAAGQVLKFIVLVSLPFILAWLCAIISEGATDWLNHKLHMPRGLAVIILILLFFGLIGMIFTLILARLWLLISDIAGNMSGYYDAVLAAIESVRLWLDGFNIGTSELAKVSEWLQGAFSDAGSWLSSIAGGTVNVLSATPAAFVFVIVFFVALFFFCRDHNKIVDKTGTLLHKGNKDKIMAVYKRFAEVIRGFCVAQLTLIGVSMLLCIIVFFILGVDGALTIGLICGLLDILPIVGPATIILPWAIISLLQHNFFLGIGLAVLQVLLVLVKNILQPKVVGDRIGLHPVLTLAGIFIGMRIFGIWGLALGPILLAMIVCVYRSFKEVNGK